MKVITDAPIYNYAGGEDDFSYLTEEEKAIKAKKREERKQRRKERRDAFFQNDYVKATIGAVTNVGAKKIQDYAGSGYYGTQSPVQFDPNAFNVQSQGNPALVNDGKGSENKTRMGVLTKVGIGVGILAVLGVATYFILKSKKGKPSKK